MEKITFTVTGMSCAHCEKAVTNALEDIGVASVTASAANQTVEVTFDSAAVSLDEIIAEIVETGYQVS